MSESQLTGSPYRTTAKMEEVSPLEIKAIELAEIWRESIRDYGGMILKNIFILEIHIFQQIYLIL